jgi:hypothetical protein
MTSSEIVHRRLISQRLSLPVFERPGEVVKWLGAVQAQDYAGAKWAIGQRLRGATEEDVERAFTDGSILRTHLMRPTWHFVAPADIRWMLALTAPRVHAANKPLYRRLGLDTGVFNRSNAAIEKALGGGGQLTREELKVPLRQAGVATDGEFRMGYLMMGAELDGIVCSGPRRGKQFTYALLEERVPQARALARDEALAELAGRYFAGHGPATLQDFAKWSGLTMTDARGGLEAVRSQLTHEALAGKSYWFAEAPRAPKPGAPAASLLSIYDEYVIGYKDRSAAFDAAYDERLRAMGNALTSAVMIDGRFVGTWKRELKKDAVMIEFTPFRRLTKAETQSLAEAARKYGEFLNLPATVV